MERTAHTPTVFAVRCRGLSLFGVLVGMAVGLIVLLAIMESLALFEGQRRTTAAVDDAQQNGVAALFHLERELRMAGHGVVVGGKIPCEVIKAYHANASPAAYDLRMAPALIRNGTGAGGDQIDVLYGTANSGGVPITTLTAGMANSYPETSFPVASTLGVAVGDRLVISRAGTGCAQLVATAISGTVITHESGSSGNTAFNPPTGTTIFPVAGVPAGSLITNYGQPMYRRFEVVGSRLVETDLAAGSSTTQTELVSGVVHLQARYGVSAAATSDVITSWVEPTGTDWGATATKPTPTNMLRIKAIRVAAVARSELLEKVDVSPATLTLWTGGPTYTVPDRRYRYRVYETIVPVRNALWGNPNPTP